MMMPSIFGNNFVDDVFDDMFPFAGGYTTANYDLMKTDVKDVGDHYELEMEMPGVEKENIKAELKDGYLTVTAQQNTNKDEKDKEGVLLICPQILLPFLNLLHQVCPLHILLRMYAGRRKKQHQQG